MVILKELLLSQNLKTYFPKKLLIDKETIADQRQIGNEFNFFYDHWSRSGR